VKRALLIARREFSVTVRRPSYIFTAFGTPILFAVLFGIIGFFAARSAGKVEPRLYAVVDSSAVLSTEVLARLAEEAQQTVELPDEVRTAVSGLYDRMSPSVAALASERFTGFRRGVAFVVMTNADSAVAAAQREEIYGALLIAGDYLESGRVWSYGKSRNIFEDEGPSDAESILRQTLMMSLVQGQGLSASIERRLLNPLNLKQFELRQAGETAGQFEERGVASALRNFGYPYFFGLLLMMSVFMSAGFLLQGVAEEKENRVIEVLLSSVTPDDLMLGKVLGLGGAGLLQVLVWLLMGAGALIAVGSFISESLQVPVALFALCLGYFLVGYLMIASLMAGAGSLGNSMRESQQLSTWFTLPVVIPFMLFTVIISEPNGIAARIFSYIPITAPLTMMLRLPTEQVPWWEIPLTFGWLILWTWLAVRLGAKVFRLGSLMYGKRPNLPELVRWIRQA
jgi:ABC-2 type transport system permease protein